MEQKFDESVVLLDHENGVAVLTLNRPAAMNAINNDIRKAVPAALRACNENPDIRVIVVRGAGSRAFCAGADIKETSPVESLTAERIIRYGWMEAFDAVHKPIIASIQGFCMGGGLEMALACDIRVAAPDAVFALPEVGLGLIPGAGGTQRLSRMVGLGRALAMQLTGERVTAQDAHHFGFVSRVAASSENVHTEAMELALSIAAKPPAAVAYVKEAIRRGLDMNLKDGLNLERDLFLFLMSTQDRLEAAQAFREKRPPVFTGK